MATYAKASEHVLKGMSHRFTDADGIHRRLPAREYEGQVLEALATSISELNRRLLAGDVCTPDGVYMMWVDVERLHNLAWAHAFWANVDAYVRAEPDVVGNIGMAGVIDNLTVTESATYRSAILGEGRHRTPHPGIGPIAMDHNIESGTDDEPSQLEALRDAEVISAEATETVTRGARQLRADAYDARMLHDFPLVKARFARQVWPNFVRCYTGLAGGIRDKALRRAVPKVIDASTLKAARLAEVERLKAELVRSVRKMEDPSLAVSASADVVASLLPEKADREPLFDTLF